MLLDGYWKNDLRRIKRSLRFWSKNRISIFSDYAEHKVNQGLLYSAVIIRKIVEDERDVKKVVEKSKLPFSPPFPVIKISVPIQKYTHVDENKFFMNSKVFLQDYNLENAENIELPLADVCNQIIHSYSWSVVYWNSKFIYEVLMASDLFKEKGIYALTIQNWIEVIQKTIDLAAI